MISSHILKLLKESRYTVALSGVEMILENGYPALRDGDISYDIEQKYGYLPEEIFSSAFFTTRPELFYTFFRDEMMEAMRIPPGKGFLSLKVLEDAGLLQGIITRRMFGLPARAGCRNVIDLYGSIAECACPHCKESYASQYVMETKGVPYCKKCGTIIRPKARLFGEMLNNAVMTRAAEEIRKADVLLVLGSGLQTRLCLHLVQYFEGRHLILIKEKEEYSDKAADLVVYGRVDDALEALAKEYRLEEQSEESGRAKA